MGKIDDLFLRNRNILVGARASGKTKEVLELSYSKLLEGQGVLFVSGYGLDASKRAFLRMKELIDSKIRGQKIRNVLLFLKPPVYNHLNLTLDYGGSMNFITLEFYKTPHYKSHLYDKHFKILDNIDANIEFDVATISGTPEEIK
jgi:hypothetical protein